MRPLMIVAMVGLGAALMTQIAAAQGAGSGSLACRIVVCKSPQLPVGDPGADDEQAPSIDLRDVTPGHRFGQATPMILPAAGLDVRIAGTPISARTDADGRFALTSLPAAQSLTLLVSTPAAPAPLLERPNVVVSAGQTLDLGTVALSDCAGLLVTSPDGAAATTVDLAQPPTSETTRTNEDAAPVETETAPSD